MYRNRFQSRQILPLRGTKNHLTYYIVRQMYSLNLVNMAKHTSVKDPVQLLKALRKTTNLITAHYWIRYVRVHYNSIMSSNSQPREERTNLVYFAKHVKKDMYAQFVSLYMDYTTKIVLLCLAILTFDFCLRCIFYTCTFI
jgi:hypothetical protein